MTCARLVAASLLLVGSVSACGGGGSDAPTDASVRDFCTAQLGLVSHLELDGSGTPSAEALAEGFQDWGREMEQVGTPEDMPDDARAAFEDFVAETQDVTADDFRGDGLEERLETLEGATDEPGQAFTAYVEETCGSVEDPGLPEVPEVPGG